MEELVPLDFSPHLNTSLFSLNLFQFFCRHYFQWQSTYSLIVMSLDYLGLLNVFISVVYVSVIRKMKKEQLIATLANAAAMTE